MPHRVGAETGQRFCGGPRGAPNHSPLNAGWQFDLRVDCFDCLFTCGDTFKSSLLVRAKFTTWFDRSSAQAGAQQDHGLSVLLRRILEHRDLTIGMLAAKALCARSDLYRQALRADSDLAIAADRYPSSPREHEVPTRGSAEANAGPSGFPFQPGSMLSAGSSRSRDGFPSGCGTCALDPRSDYLPESVQLARCKRYQPGLPS